MNKNEVALQLTLKILDKSHFNFQRTTNENFEKYGKVISNLTSIIFNELIENLKTE